MADLGELQKKTSQTTGAIGKSDTVTPIFKRNIETTQLEEGVSILSTVNMGTTAIYGPGGLSTLAMGTAIPGSSFHGWYGTSLYGDARDLGTIPFPKGDRIRVVNPLNVYREYLRNQIMIDDANTTCTIDTTNFRLTFSNGQRFQSRTLFMNFETIEKATLSVLAANITSGENLTYFLSANGGVNFESVTLNTSHTFTNQGQELLLRIVASGAATINIDKQTAHVDINTGLNETLAGQSTPIAVSYEVIN